MLLHGHNLKISTIYGCCQGQDFLLVDEVERERHTDTPLQHFSLYWNCKSALASWQGMTLISGVRVCSCPNLRFERIRVCLPCSHLGGDRIGCPYPHLGGRAGCLCPCFWGQAGLSVSLFGGQARLSVSLFLGTGWAVHVPATLRPCPCPAGGMGQP